MEKVVNGYIYYIPSNLTPEQEAIYCHIIDWKRKNITAERGIYRGHEYDAILADNTSVPAMIYTPLIRQLEEMQKGEFAYKPHKFAHHAVSSQTACINLFMPLLLSDEANDILQKIPGCPSDFKEIARKELFKGFCFEYWGQDIKQGKGVLNDHSSQAGTDADVAIAYNNMNGELCLWLIEHKLSEKEFTECGAYKSKTEEANEVKENCKKCNLATIAANPQYQGETGIKGCPFRRGLNQLWRNQMLAFALKETKTYQNVTFSVCHHANNTMLKHSIDQYKALIDNDRMFSSFTNYDILNAINTDAPKLRMWKQWYEEVYCF